GVVRTAVMRRGLIAGRKLTNTGEFNVVPRYLPDGSGIVWQNSDGKRAAQYRVIPRGSDFGNARALMRFDGANKIAPLPAGGGAVVDRGMIYRDTYAYTDLYRVSWAGARERLTNGMRASSPDVSPDGRWVTFTINGNSRQRLAIMPLVAGATPEILWQG